ncbi:MAG: hypothetical protein ABEJ59_04595 [Halanaeroarchaeum sp.]
MTPPTPGPGIVESLARLLGSLLVGGLAIAAGTSLVVGEGDLTKATITAGLGALVWAFLDGVPLLGTLLALVGWIAVVRVRHDTGWLGATATGLVAWLVAAVLVFAMATLGLPVNGAIGVPGT